MAEITEEMIEQELWKMAQEKGLSATPMSKLEALRTLIDFKQKQADKP